MKMTFDDIKAMGPAAAVRKAHEMFPHLDLEWCHAQVREWTHTDGTLRGCCCAAALLNHAMGESLADGEWSAVPEQRDLLANVSWRTMGTETWEQAIAALEKHFGL